MLSPPTTTNCSIAALLGFSGHGMFAHFFRVDSPFFLHTTDLYRLPSPCIL